MGIRVVKTALAALLAIYTAVYLGLEPPLSAGLLAILGVEVTRLKGLRSVAARFAASMVGLALASLIFTAFGFAIWALSLFILIVFPALVRLQLKDGIVTCSVIVFHLFGRGEVSASLFLNEALLLLSGLGWATAVNWLYMPREDRRLEQLRARLETLFGDIFRELAMTLRDAAHVWDGAQLLEAERVIQAGVGLANRSRENRIWRHQAYWDTYFDMRGRQFEIIQHMTAMVAFVYQRIPQSEPVVALLRLLAEDIKSDTYTGNAERELTALESGFRSLPLPATREEFEVRAALLQLCRELERYLAIARQQKKKKASENG